MSEPRECSVTSSSELNRLQTILHHDTQHTTAVRWNWPHSRSWKWVQCELIRVHAPPVLFTLGGELVVKRCSAAVDPVGCGGAAVFPQPAVWQVQHGPPLESLQAGRGNEAWNGQRLLPQLRTHKMTNEGRKMHTGEQFTLFNYWVFTFPSCLRSSWMLIRTLSRVVCHLSGVWFSSLSSLSMSWGNKNSNIWVMKPQKKKKTFKGFVHELLQRWVWWWRPVGRGSRCCNTATRSSSYCWRWFLPPRSSPTSQPSSSSHNTAQSTESRPWRSPIYSGWGCWWRASESPTRENSFIFIHPVFSMCGIVWRETMLQDIPRIDLTFVCQISRL